MVLSQFNIIYMKTLHCNDLGACELCDHCFEKKHPWYYCRLYKDEFGEISDPNDCEDFEELYYEDEDDNDNDIDPNVPVECPRCGNDAYWGGSNYECGQCGWCGFPDD